MMKTDPATVLAQYPESQKLHQALPTSLQSEVETSTEIEGTITTSIGDIFEQKDSVIEYKVDTGQSDSTELHFVDSKPLYQTGSRVKIQGISLENELIVTPSNDSVQVITDTPKVLGVSTPYKVAVIMMNFQNNTSQPQTENQIRAITFTDTDTNGANAFYKESSHNLLNLTSNTRIDGDIFGWYTIPTTNTTYCNQFSWASMAKTLAQNDGFDPNNYDSIIYAMPYTSVCPWSGWGTFGGQPAQAWINGNLSTYVVAHELGHNLGLYHANSYRCFDVTDAPISISVNCESTEYNDVFDIMGYWNTNHFNTTHKGQAHFLETSNSQTITTTGDYSLIPNELGSTAIKNLVIPTGRTTALGKKLFYYVELRQRYGLFGQNLPNVGVFIHLADAMDTQNHEQTQLIDTTPETDSFLDAPLTLGHNFSDTAEGISITTTALSDTAAVVHIDVSPPQCVLFPPSLEFIPADTWNYPGSTTQFWIAITNKNSSSCPPETVTINSINAPGLTSSIPTPTKTLSSGKTGYVDVRIGSSATTPPGNYTMIASATNTSTQIQTYAIATLQIVANPNSPTPTPTPQVTCVTPGQGKRADFNHDRYVNLLDYQRLLQEFLKNLPSYTADANCDGIVSLLDYQILLSEFLK